MDDTSSTSSEDSAIFEESPRRISGAIMEARLYQLAAREPDRIWTEVDRRAAILAEIRCQLAYIRAYRTQKGQLKFHVCWKTFEACGPIWEDGEMIVAMYRADVREYLCQLKHKHRNVFNRLLKRWPMLAKLLSERADDETRPLATRRPRYEHWRRRREEIEASKKQEMNEKSASQEPPRHQTGPQAVSLSDSGTSLGRQTSPSPVDLTNGERQPERSMLDHVQFQSDRVAAK